MDIKLPTKLDVVPLVDAIFEVRFSNSEPVSTVLPSYLYNNIKGKKEISTLPIAQIPKEVRKNDPNLMYAPTIRVELDDCFVSIGDSVFAISSKLPYPGWCNFKDIILNVFKIALESNMLTNISRFSVKCINILDNIILENKSVTDNVFELDLNVAGNDVKKSTSFQIRYELSEDSYQHIVQIVSDAKIELYNNEIKYGAIVDIDTISNIDNFENDNFYDNLDKNLELIHTSNKLMFFKCLTKDTIKSLKPTYD